MVFWSGLAGGVWLLAVAFTLYGTWLVLRHFNSPPPHLDAPFALFPVSILKPLKGLEDGMEDNVESFFRLNYPVHEILFSVTHPSDPAREVVERLIRRYPEVPARLLIGDAEVGPNPKINNLLKSYEEARYDWLLISDSNVRVKADYLRNMVAHLENGVGMVTHVVAGSGGKGMGGFLESVFLNTFYARGMILTWRHGHPCVVGKSMLFQKSVARRFGGIRVLARYLAEDFMAGEAMRRLGLRVIIAREPVHQYIGEYSVHSFWLRHLRWGRIRKAQAPLAFAVEPLLGAILAGISGAFAASRLLSVSPAAFLSVHLILCAFCDLCVLTRLKVGMTAALPVAWFVRELLAIPMWICIASGNTVNWRGKRFVIQPGGTLESDS